jgi:putative ABC transport system permease protein
MTHDVRLTVRLLAKSPGYTLATIVTLALAIGANAAVFSAVYTVLLKPLPIRDPGQLVVGWGSDRAHNLPVVELSYRVIETISRDVRGFSSVAAMGSTTWPAWLKDRGGAAQRVSLAGVSGSFFETLGVVPARGRLFQRDDDVPNAPPIAVISYDAWRTRFGGDPSIVGTRVKLNDRLHTIVGVMPAGFDVPRGTEFWTPVVPIIAASSSDALDNVGVLYFVGRVARGATASTATQELRQFVDAQRVPTPTNSPPDLVVTPFVQFTLGPVRQALWALLAAVGILLLIGCANVSGLMLTRVSLRRREHAIRHALGATPAAIGRLWVLETVLLASVGGLLGFGASHWIVKILVALAPPDVPRLAEVVIDLRVLMFSFVVVLATAILCGVGPIRHAAAADLVQDLGAEARATATVQTRRLPSAMVVLQIGLSVALLVAATLVVRSFINLRRIDLGFTPAGVLTMNVAPSNPKPSPSVWIEELLTRIRRLPHVDAAGAVYLRPLALGVIGQETQVTLEGQSGAPAVQGQNPGLNYEIATPGYFTAMGIALRRGRLFDARDDVRSPPVIVVGQSTARRLWPGQEPIGKRVRMPNMLTGAPDARWRTVIGVVDDVRYRGLDDVRLDIYEAALQAPLDALTIVVRTSQNTITATAAVQAAARRLDPAVYIDGVTTMDAAVGRLVAPWRFSAWTFGVFAAFAFALSIVGLFGLVLLEVSGRWHELAIRSAIGAARTDLLATILLPAARRAVAGAALGLAASIAAHRTLRSLLFGIDSIDAVTYAGVIAVVACVVMIASYIPARKAAAVDPLSLFTRQS